MMGKTPLVTVLMSVYNGELYLREAVESILDQSFKDFEFLIVDDGSTDGTREILEHYRRHPKIRVVFNERNVGLTRSLNIGLKLARGKYIARMDADDIAYPDRLECEVGKIEEDQLICVVSSWFDTVGGDTGFYSLVRKINTPEEIFYSLFWRNCIAHPTVLFSKSRVLSVGGYDERYRSSQDYDLWVRLSRMCKMVKIQKALLVRRVHSDMISRVDGTQRSYANEIFIKNIESFLPEEEDISFLLRLRDNQLGLFELPKGLKMIRAINAGIMKSQPFWLDREKVYECGREKMRDLVERSIRCFGKGVKVFRGRRKR